MKFLKEHIKSIPIILLMAMPVMACHYFDKPEPLTEEHDDNMPFPPAHLPPQSTHTIQGTVLRYGSNPQGDIDKLLFGINEDSLWLHFPPHTAKRLLSIARLHTMVTIEYAERGERKGDRGMGDIQKISNEKNELVDLKIILPPPPLPGKEVTIDGNKVEVKKDETGRVTAFILSGKLIPLPPPAAGELLPLIMVAKTIQVKGIERDVSGFVNSNGLTLVRPDEIIIDGVTYLVR